MMRIAVTGTSGQLVTAMVERACSDCIVIPVGRPGLDLGQPKTIAPAIEAVKPDIVVSAAAYTAVDKAEADSEMAFAVNERGAGEVAAAAAALGIPVIHISTDYVFDGKKAEPYVETDATAPQSAYGASKLAGEIAVAAANPNHAILRTAWVYSPFGNNFLKTMLRLAADRDEVGVVADQYGNPTSALDLADAVFAVARNLLESDRPDLRGIFHATATQNASWAEFAEAIFAASSRVGGPTAKVNRITTAQYPTPAPRPINSRLDGSRLRAVHGHTLSNWHSSTDQIVGRVVLGRKATQLTHQTVDGRN